MRCTASGPSASRESGSRRVYVYLLLAAAAGCANDRGRHRPARHPDHVALVESGLVIGEFALPQDAVIDGDTIRVADIESTLRLIAVDTEETFKTDRERALFAQGWPQYLQKMRGDSPQPVKMATPAGEAAKQWAVQFFAGVTAVRLERDQPREIHGRYGRLLAYVMVKRDSGWVNYNVECVRAGMSPYFTKYGYSRRFHGELVAAQEQARSAGLGIWSPTERHYPDYDERLAWWDRRARIIQEFEQQAESHPEYIVLTREPALEELGRRVGREVEILAGVAAIKRGRGPIRVMLSRRRGQDFPLVFFDPAVFAATGLDQQSGEYVRARGIVSVYRHEKSNRAQLQIVVERPDQVVVP